MLNQGASSFWTFGNDPVVVVAEAEITHQQLRLYRGARCIFFLFLILVQ